MKTAIDHRRPRAAWLLLAAPALIATPALAQDAAPIAPPPVRPTIQQAAPPTTTPPVAVPVRAQTPPPSRETGNPVDANTANAASPTRIAPGAADVVDEARIAARAERTPARPPARAPARAPAAAPAPVEPPAPATAPAAAEPTAPAPVAAAPAATPPAADPAASPADTAADGQQSTVATTAEDGGSAPIWPIFALIAIAVIGGAGYLMWRRRREAAYDEYEAEYVDEAAYAAEPAYVEPAPIAIEPAPVDPVPARAAPVAAAIATPAAIALADRPAEPLATADDATVSDAEAGDVAALTDAAPPVRNRPWLEFAMRPVRAGTNADEALVEIELTVANAGSIPAKDVRVSTFMLTDANASEMENMLVDAPADAAVDPVTIAPGEGARIDATLAALKADLGGGVGGGFTPVVVADARYTLPDGSEGRTSASFVVGVAHDDGALAPFDLADRVMREDIEARLHGEVEHA